MLAALDSLPDIFNVKQMEWSPCFAILWSWQELWKESTIDGQYVWNWTSAQELEATAEEEENTLSRLWMEGLSTTTKTQKLLFLASMFLPSSQEATVIRHLIPVRYYSHQWTVACEEQWGPGEPGLRSSADGAGHHWLLTAKWAHCLPPASAQLSPEVGGLLLLSGRLLRAFPESVVTDLLLVHGRILLLRWCFSSLAVFKTSIT